MRSGSKSPRLRWQPPHKVAAVTGKLRIGLVGFRDTVVRAHLPAVAVDPRGVRASADAVFADPAVAPW